MQEDKLSFDQHFSNLLMIYKDKIETSFPGFLYFRSPLSLLNITPGERKDRRPGNEFDSNFEDGAQVCCRW